MSDVRLEKRPTIHGPIVFDKEWDYRGRSLRHYPKWLPYLTAAVCVGVGTYSSMAFKWQLKIKAPGCDGCPEELFNGALMQAQIMFIGEALALVVWYIDDAESRKTHRSLLFEFMTKESELLRPPTHWYFWPLGSLHDTVATVCTNIALRYCYAATVQMLRNFMVVAAATLQMIIVRKALVLSQWIGVTLITLAMVLTAIPAFKNPEDSSHTSGEIVLGVVLALVSTIVQADQMLIEEWIMRRGRYPMLKALGIEGCSGFIYCLILWGPFQKLVEDVNKSWYMQFHSKMLGMITGIYIPGALVFNGAGLGSVKLGGGLLRGVCSASRAPVVWLLSLAVKWQEFDPWNFASVIVFIVAFAFYVNQVPWLRKKAIMNKPIHLCCLTNPAMDGILPGHEREALAHKETDENKEVQV